MLVLLVAGVVVMAVVVVGKGIMGEVTIENRDSGDLVF